MRLIKKAIDTATRQTLLGNSTGRCSTESQRAERFHHRQQNQLDFAAEWRSPWRLAIRNMFPLAFMQKKHCKKLGAWDTLSPKLAPAEDVRGALALVERNEAPLGIVYGSDAVASKGGKSGCHLPGRFT